MCSESTDKDGLLKFVRSSSICIILFWDVIHKNQSKWTMLHRSANFNIFPQTLHVHDLNPYSLPPLILLSIHHVSNDDHVYGVRLRLWTAATNGPIVHPLDDTWAWRTIVDWCRRRITPWQSYRRSHQVANRRNGRREWWIWPCEVFLFIFASYFAAKSYVMRPTTLLPPTLKEVVLRTFIAFENPWLRLGLNPRSLGIMASAVTIAPPRRRPRRWNTGPNSNSWTESCVWSKLLMIKINMRLDPAHIRKVVVDWRSDRGFPYTWP
jgi:hypothetical protein